MYMYVLCTFISLLSFQQVKARGNVENWLGLVEDSMVVSLRKLTKASLADFDTKPRHIWATQHASQVIPYINTYIAYYYSSSFGFFQSTIQLSIYQFDQYTLYVY